MRRQYGYPGHFIAAPWCLFHLHTSVDGRYRVSTVGDYRPAHERHVERVGPMREIGYQRYFETMVFRLGRDGDPASWSEMDADGYATAEEAAAGHEAMCAKYEAKCADAASEDRVYALARCVADSAAEHADAVAAREGWQRGDGLWEDEASDHLHDERSDHGPEVHALARELLKERAQERREAKRG